ncbi:serine hydrolase domain-containing protein [Catellatospora sp. NPDC049609]|uniref:serine hydrolase domain-containing protein n=1 Tax=Catellatospora sp. NPDC049609 TaxID=3155505 RepID=UPI0034429327
MPGREIGRLARTAGYRDGEPLVVGVSRRGDPEFVCQGPYTPTTLVYAASLSKQLVAACALLVAQRGGLAVDEPLSLRLPELPGWAGAVRLRHLVHHTGGLPADAAVDGLLTGDRTTAGVLAALATLPSPARPPGTAYAYSNTGYVCLAEAVRRAAGRELPGLAHELLFAPLGMARSRLWDGPHPAPPGARPLTPRHPAPLSLGDGGLWTTAADLLRWADALNTGALGVSGLLQTPGRLDDGTALDYAWGMGVCRRHGYTYHRHGGAWPGVRTMLARVPDRGLGLVVIAPGDATERAAALTDLLLDLLLT